MLRPGACFPGASLQAQHSAVYPVTSGPGTSLVLRKRYAATSYGQQPPTPHPLPHTGASFLLPDEFLRLLPLEALPSGPSSSGVTLNVDLWKQSEDPGLVAGAADVKVTLS